jgi:adenylate cyclase 1
MSFLPLVTFLRLPVLLKTALVLPMAGVYFVVIEWTHKSLFICYDTAMGSHVPLHLMAVIVIGHFVLVVLTHGRQVEWTARLDFLWNLQVSVLLPFVCSLPPTRLLLVPDPDYVCLLHILVPSSLLPLL